MIEFMGIISIIVVSVLTNIIYTRLKYGIPSGTVSINKTTEDGEDNYYIALDMRVGVKDLQSMKTITLKIKDCTESQI